MDWVTRAYQALLNSGHRAAVEVFFAQDERQAWASPERKVWRQLPPELSLLLFQRVLAYCRDEHEQLTEAQIWDFFEAYRVLQRYERRQIGLLDWKRIGDDIEEAIPHARQRYQICVDQGIGSKEAEASAAD